MRYIPTPVSNNSPEDLRAWLLEEFRRISASYFVADEVRLQQLTVAPAKPRDGMIVLADGTEWNPGSGGGIYAYYAGSWSKLG